MGRHAIEVDDLENESPSRGKDRMEFGEGPSDFPLILEMCQGIPDAGKSLEPRTEGGFQFFHVSDMEFQGTGTFPPSGFRLRQGYHPFIEVDPNDSARLFGKTFRIGPGSAGYIDNRGLSLKALPKKT